MRRREVWILRFQHNRLYDNQTLRSVLGDRFISPLPVNEAYVGTLWACLRRTLSASIEGRCYEGQ